MMPDQITPQTTPQNGLKRPAIGYYRVSTAKQGASGLGLEAQKTAVQRYAAANGLTIAQEFVEIESGTGKRRRVVIYQALQAAQDTGAVLLIAKLDRLARNVHFISGLMQSGVKFTACDMPTINELTLHILAAVAQEEGRAISQRTKAALAAAKARGVTLGSPGNLTQEARETGAAANRQAAIDAYRKTAGYAAVLRDQGQSLAAIAERLNSEGHRTRHGRPFQPMTVKRILDRRLGIQ